jgi:hypothetical protein
MSKTTSIGNKLPMPLSFVAAGTTVIAGLLHLTMVPGSISHNLGEGILFLVGGILQVFWAFPVIKRWGRIWQIIGIVGTAIFVALYFSDRLHLMPEGTVDGGGPPGITHQGEFQRGSTTSGGEIPREHMQEGIRIGGIALPIEICQIAFIGLYVVLIKLYPKKENQ